MQVKYTDIIDMASAFTLLLLDSEAGGGKSTTTQFGFNDWSMGGHVMKTMDYDFIFSMRFRDQHLCSLKELINELIPEDMIKISIVDVMTCIADASLNILFFCDGYDEKNIKSEQVFQDICNLAKIHQHVKIIVTSRPESIRELYYKFDQILKIEHLKILGIEESKRAEFLRKYHDEFIKAGVSGQSTDDLLKFYKSCSTRHKQLYRLPINLVILAWLWGNDPQKVKPINSAAGLYTAVIEIFNEKLKCRIIQSYPDVMDKINHDIDELHELIDNFKEQVYEQSLIALRYDRIYIDSKGVKCLNNVCRNNGLPFSELKGAYLLSKLEWKITLSETLEFPHKGFLEFYAAKCIEIKLIQGKNIKNILLELYGKHHKKYQWDKYQNSIQFLGGILALNDANLVEEHGQDIINFLKETGIGNNTQWYTVYSDLKVNSTAAEKFAILIAPHLDLNNFTIKDAEVEILSALLKYVEISTVTLDISDTEISTQLPTLLDVLRTKKSIINIFNIEDKHVSMWNASIKQNYKINIENVVLKTEHKNLPFLSYLNFIGECHLFYLWRELHTAAPDMSRWPVRLLRTAAATTDALPTTLKQLYLGLLVDPTSGAAKDPGLDCLTQQCPHLELLGVHVKSGSGTDHLPNLPKLQHQPYLYLSQLNNCYLQWAVETARTLKPSGGYFKLCLPSCDLRVQQLCDLVRQLSTAWVVVGNAIVISSPHSNQEEWQLKQETRKFLHCDLLWYQNDEELRCKESW
ncbi:unnamed protein product [Meganyctiphanes norvegica]|uniref:NACHT domain-containing protein n=1 Tax=Meganyctiphanes norvegica TaxID=48144 RepID=A0AAV2RS43_MEGNR